MKQVFWRACGLDRLGHYPRTLAVHVRAWRRHTRRNSRIGAVDAPVVVQGRALNMASVTIFRDLSQNAGKPQKHTGGVLVSVGKNQHQATIIAKHLSVNDCKQ